MLKKMTLTALMSLGLVSAGGAQAPAPAAPLSATASIVNEAGQSVGSARFVQ